MFHGVTSKGVGAVRKRTIRNGLRLIMAALVLIVLASFYHVQLSELFSLSSAAGYYRYFCYDIPVLLSALLLCRYTGQGRTEARTPWRDHYHLSDIRYEN